MIKENMGRNAEHYADPTPTAAMRNICRDEYQKEAAPKLVLCGGIEQ